MFVLDGTVDPILSGGGAPVWRDRDMLRLLMPEARVDLAALQEFFVPPDIVDLTALEDQDRIRGHQRG